jgi:putative acetyltransferase
MYVRPEARGKGTVQQVVDFLESAASAQGCEKVFLETGPYSYQALAFYEKKGYGRCGPYCEYPDHPLSVFMRKQLALSHQA